jgi:glycyl-tRNA synthetase beta subunit
VHHTHQIFFLTDRQQQYLRDRGISQDVINAMLAGRND